jgi:hypothetical protein
MESTFICCASALAQVQLKCCSVETGHARGQKIPRARYFILIGADFTEALQQSTGRQRTTFDVNLHFFSRTDNNNNNPVFMI